MMVFHRVYHIPCHVYLHDPNSGEVRAYWDIPGMTCLYHYHFKVGFILHLPPLVGEICDYYEIAHAQLMLNGWLTLMAAKVLAEIYEIDIRRNEILTTFKIHAVNGERGMYQLNARLISGLCVRMIENGEDCDRYSQAFFFVPFASL